MPNLPPPHPRARLAPRLAIAAMLLALAGPGCGGPDETPRPGASADSRTRPPLDSGPANPAPGPAIMDSAPPSAVPGRGATAPDPATAASTPTATVEPQAPDSQATITIVVYFTRDERPVSVQRTVPATHEILRVAILELLKGPTPEERADGITSFFSDRTAGMLNDATVDERGHAVVDFKDLRPVIPNASTSAGSTILLGELNSTVFAIPTLESVEYRIDGRCDVFWEWLQYGGCQPVTRESR